MRRADARDLPAIVAIQQACPEAAQWRANDYLEYQVCVAVCPPAIIGFVAGRTPIRGESEILNLAVAPDWRRQGVARALLETWFHEFPGDIFLEVRASNRTAQRFYNSLGFQEVMTRREYYANPVESAIVMKFHSC